MDPLYEVGMLLGKAQRDASLYYAGIFYRDTEIISKTSSRSANLSSYLGRLVERSLETNEIIPGFRQEFLFAEGKDFSILIYYLPENISIGFVHFGKPNFSLLKVTASDLAKALNPYIAVLKQFYVEKLSKQTVSQEKTPLSARMEDDHTGIYQPEKMPGEENNRQASKHQELPSIEDILVSEIEIQSDTGSTQNLDAFTDAETPSIEEILKQDLNSDRHQHQEETVGDMTEILEKIRVEFVKEIGPFGNFLFKRKSEDLLSRKSVTKFEILKFINLLSEDINIPEKKSRFIERAKSYLMI